MNPPDDPILRKAIETTLENYATDKMLPHRAAFHGNHQTGASPVPEQSKNWCPRRESNPHQRFRKPLFYPLNYGDCWYRYLMSDSLRFIANNATKIASWSASISDVCRGSLCMQAGSRCFSHRCTPGLRCLGVKGGRCYSPSNFTSRCPVMPKCSIAACSCTVFSALGAPRLMAEIMTFLPVCSLEMNSKTLAS